MSRLRHAYRRYLRLVSTHQRLTRRFIRRQATNNISAPVFLDLGAGSSAYRGEFEQAFAIRYYISSDLAPTDQTRIILDAHALPFSSDSVDMVAAISIIAVIDDSRTVFQELARVIPVSGHLLVEYAFVTGETRDEQDLRRWSRMGIERDLNEAGFEVIDHQIAGGALVALVFLAKDLVVGCTAGGRRAWRSDGSFWSTARLAGTAAALLPLDLLATLCAPVDRLLPSPPVYPGGFVLARRRVQ